MTITRVEKPWAVGESAAVEDEGHRTTYTIVAIDGDQVWLKDHNGENATELLYELVRP